jgi:hypothetical protein
MGLRISDSVFQKTFDGLFCKSDARGGCGGSFRGVTCHEIEAQRSARRLLYHWVRFVIIDTRRNRQPGYD